MTNSDSSEIDELFGLDNSTEENTEFAQLCVAAVDVSVALLDVIGEGKVRSEMVSETNAALEVLRSIPDLNKSHLKKMKEKLDTLARKNN